MNSRPLLLFGLLSVSIACDGTKKLDVDWDDEGDWDSSTEEPWEESSNEGDGATAGSETTGATEGDEETGGEETGGEEWDGEETGDEETGGEETGGEEWDGEEDSDEGGEGSDWNGGGDITIIINTSFGPDTCAGSASVEVSEDGMMNGSGSCNFGILGAQTPTLTGIVADDGTVTATVDLSAFGTTFDLDWTGYHDDNTLTASHIGADSLVGVGEITYEIIVNFEGETSEDGGEGSTVDGDAAVDGEEATEGGGEEWGSDEGGDEGGGAGSVDGGGESFISFEGTYAGIIGRAVATTEDTCTESAILYVDVDNTFFVSGFCSGWGGDRDMRFEGAFSDDGEASGLFIAEIFATEYEGEIEGNIHADAVSLSAEIDYGVGELTAFFYTE